MIRKSKGFTLIETLIVIGIMTVIALTVFDTERHVGKVEKAKLQAQIVQRLMEESLEYYTWDAAKSGDPGGISPDYWPIGVSDLIFSGFIRDCTGSAKSNGDCRDPRLTIWGDALTLEPGVQNGDMLLPVLDITIPLASVPTEDRPLIEATLLNNLPNSHLVNGQIELALGRPGTEVSHDAFVRTDGTRPLTAAWDVGNQHISGVKDITFAGLQDKTAVGGLTWTHIVDNSSVVPVVDCPAPLVEKVFVTPVTYSCNEKACADLGAVDSYFDPSTRQAIVRLWAFKEVEQIQDWIVPSGEYAKVRVDIKCDRS